MTHQAHISDYRILLKNDPHALTSAVMSAIHEGWQPWGAVFKAGSGGETGAGEAFCQAVVRYSEWYR
jgi:hypothetical protein